MTDSDDRPAAVDICLTQLPHWEKVDEGGVSKLRRRYPFRNFSAALGFVQQLAAVAERCGHHPEITFGWGYASVTWWTHTAGGVQDRDCELAAETDRLYQISAGRG